MTRSDESDGSDSYMNPQRDEVMMKARLNRVGFTLPELMVVVAVIVLVFGVMLPVLGVAREKARRVNCAGNLKSMGLALLMYSGDFDGYFVNVNGNSPRHGNFEPIAGANYCQDGKVWACPSRSVVLTLCANSAYRYIGSGLKDDNARAKSSSLAYDERGNHPENRWMNILMIDGHAEGGRPGSRASMVND